MSQVNVMLERIASLAKDLKLSNLEPQIAACRRQCNGRQSIDVAVFGRFKAGKSSFLNSLTGRPVLPIGVVPLTAVITRLRYGPTERAEARFVDGTAKAVPVEDIRAHVCEDANPGNEKGVSSVEVELPVMKALAPLEFVDTPGLGSAFVHNTEAALKWLPNVGAALVAVSCDAPLSERDLGLLEELKRHTPRIVLLLTKADLLNEAQRAEVLAFVRQQLGQRWGSELPVFFYSVRPEGAAFKEELERELLLPLVRDRGQASKEIARHKLVSLAGQTRGYVQVALAAATQADSARQALRAKLADERRQADLLRAELNVPAAEWSASALEYYLRELQPMEKGIQAKVAEALREQLAAWRLRLPRLVAAWRGWLNRFLRSELAEVSHAEQAMFCAPLHKTERHLARVLGAFHDRLAGHVRSALGVTLTRREFGLEVREPEAPPVDVAYAFDAAFTIVAWLVPLAFFRKPIERVLLRKTRYEVEKNLSRLAAEWRDRVAAGIKGLTGEAERLALEELEALERLAAGAVSDAAELERALKELDGFQRNLQSEPGWRVPSVI
jgi:GTP-binding protein EngB required for normal cell division